MVTVIENVCVAPGASVTGVTHVNGRAGGLPPLHVKVEAVIGAGTEAPATNIASEICTLPPNGCVLVFLTDKANVHDEPGLH